MRFGWFPVILALFVCGLFSACQPADTAQTDEAEGDPFSADDSSSSPLPGFNAERYGDIDVTGQTVLFWHPFAGPTQDALQAIVDAFNRSNAYEIRVQLESQGNYQSVFSRTLAAAGTSAAPDLVQIYQNQAADLHLEKRLVDQSALIEHPLWGFSAAERADFFPGIFEQDVYSVFDGARLGLPFSRSADVLVYNRDWLLELGVDSPPDNSEAFRRLACAAAETPFSQTSMERSFGYELNIDASRFASWVFAFGGDLFNEQSNAFTLNDPGAVAAMRLLQELVGSGCVSLSGEWYGDLSRFGDGGLLFTVGSSGNLRAVHRAVEDGRQFVWNAAPLPGGDLRLNVYGASLSIPVSTPERELAAWVFARYLTEPEVQAEWAMATGALPVRAQAGEYMIDFLANNPAERVVFELLAEAQAEPSVPGYDVVRQEIETAMDGIMAGANVEATLDALNQAANAILEERLNSNR